jgi:hypothetical protein
MNGKSAFDQQNVATRGDLVYSGVPINGVALSP